MSNFLKESEAFEDEVIAQFVIYSPKLFVQSDGKTTIATYVDDDGRRYYGKARLHPNDEFYFNLGQVIALVRLYNKLK